MASKAAITIGKYAGKQPAMTALTAADLIVNSRPVAGCLAMIVSDGRPSKASIASTLDACS